MRVIRFFIVLLLAACGKSEDTKILSDRYSLCAKSDGALHATLREGIDAAAGVISINGEVLNIALDPFPYYPARQKLEDPASNASSLRVLDSGEYRTIDGVLNEMSVSVYQNEGRNVFVVLSGPANRSVARAIDQTNKSLCVCGHCR